MRILLEVSYDGSAYHGWQVQDGQITVAGVLESAIKDLTGETVELLGASRTDAGVHARGNVAVFDTQSTIPPERFALAVNNYLPEDIRVMESREVPEDFVPRFQAKNKTYLYRIQNSLIPDPLRRLYVYHAKGKIDVSAMEKAAGYIEGQHDFTSFSSVHTQVKSFVRTVYFCRVSKVEDEIQITINGDGFLYNMVRIIAGTLLSVGYGKIPPESIKEIIEKKDRCSAGETLPPNGLTLLKIAF